MAWVVFSHHQKVTALRSNRLYGEQAASSFAKSFASGHTPVHPVDHPKVSDLYDPDWLRNVSPVLPCPWCRS